MVDFKSDRTNQENNNNYPYSTYDCECCHCKKIFMMLVLLILTFMAGIMVGNCVSKNRFYDYMYNPYTMQQYNPMRIKKMHRGMHNVNPNIVQNSKSQTDEPVGGFIVEIDQSN